MKGNKISVLMGIALWVGVVSGVQNTPDHKLLFEKAKFAMETKGDLQGAIKLFQEIVAKYPQEKEYAAKAQLYIGLCYEKLGNSEAVKAYELVLKNFADRPEEVAVARERLAALRGKKASEFTAEKILPQNVYLESLCLSSDGTKIAGIDFSVGQNVALYDLAAKRLQLVTHHTWRAGSCFAYFPVFSPNGREIVYSIGCWESNYQTQDATELWVSTLEGKSRHLFRAEQAGLIPCNWLPDGNAIVVLMVPKDKRPSLGLVASSGGSFKILHSMQGEADRLLAAPADVSPDGRYIAFQDGAQDGKRDIYVIGTDGRSLTVLSDHPADDKEPRWSPDGKNVIFLSNRHGNWRLWGIPVKEGSAGGQQFLIREGMEDCTLLNWTKSGLVYASMIMMRDVYAASLDPATCEITENPKQLAFTPTGLNSSPVWSPDGKFLAFGSFSLSEPSQGQIVVLPSSGVNAKKYPLSPLAEKGIIPRYLLWLPDGSGFGFSAQDRVTDQSYLCDLKCDLAEWKIQPIKATRIRWNKNGKAYFYFSEKGLIERSLETGNERVVYAVREGPEIMGRYNLAFSRDYKQAAWVSELQKSPGIWLHQITIMDLSSGKIRVFERDFDCPQWAPDGQHLLALGAFTKNNLPTAIFALDLRDRGTRKLDLGNSLPKGSEILSIDWSPDGHRIAFDGRMVRTENLLMNNVLAKNEH